MSAGINWPLWGATIGIAAVAGWWMYRDARSRDANPVLWTAGIALSALTGSWIGALAVVGAYTLVRPRGVLLVCPHCKRRYIHNLAFCPHCGKPVKKECLRCHDTMELDAEICPHCGLKAL